MIPIKGNFRTPTFADVWGKADDFVNDFLDNGIEAKISPNSCRSLYYLLYARYGNSHIASWDINQFRYKCWSIIFSFGPTWERRLKLQDDLRKLSDDQLRESATSIYNHAFNPSTDPTTQTTSEIEYINDQNVTKHRRSLTDAYAILNDLLKTDVTQAFLGKFAKLFVVVAEPYWPLWYSVDAEDDNE